MVLRKTIMMAGALLFAITFFACLAVGPFWPFFIVHFSGVCFLPSWILPPWLLLSVLSARYRDRASPLSCWPLLLLWPGSCFGMFIINHYDFTYLFLACAGLSLCAFFFSWKLQGPYRKDLNRGFLSANGVVLSLKSLLRHSGLPV